MRYIILALLGLVATPGTGYAQDWEYRTPEAHANLEAAKPRLLCGQDARTFVERRVDGKTLLVCTDGTMSELLRINERTVIAEVQVATPFEADDLREREEVRRQQRQYSTPYFGGGSGYYGGYSNQGYQCLGNVSTIRDYNTEYCRNQRRQYEMLRKNQHNPCLGNYAYRYPDVCERWRNGTYGRR